MPIFNQREILKKITIANSVQLTTKLIKVFINNLILLLLNNDLSKLKKTVNYIILHYVFKNTICNYANSNLPKQVKNFLSIKRNDRDGHYFQTTKTRAKNLKKVFDEEEGAKEFTFRVRDRTINIKFSELIFKPFNAAIKINHPMLQKYSQLLATYEIQLAKLSLIEFSDLLSKYYIEYSLY